MRIEEEKTVTKVVVEKKIIARKCDVCGENVEPSNYFKIDTYHNDWGYDSFDSHKQYDACSPRCVLTFTEKYIIEAYSKWKNTKTIEIEHVNCLESGAIEE